MGRIGVYILLCSNGRYYTGSTDNLDRRFGPT
ncbi:MAG: GIY-YIG nuclease family protein [Chitinophagales bacterium]|nr:GIY-YIG nuclease family protein [Chitinophagales bacterium]